MGNFREQGFGERLSTAANAKKAMLERFRARSGTDDPAVLERQAARQAISVAREARITERKDAREAKVAREAAEQAEREAEAARQAAAMQAEQAAREAVLEAERKAARDARYAA